MSSAGRSPLTPLHPLVSLVRRWAVEWLAAGNAAVCEEILAPEYGIFIGGHRLEGRDAYVAGALAQLERFPGLGLTVHELVCGEEGLAARFTLHGASINRASAADGSSPLARPPFRAAAWRGVALFAWDGERLSHCWAEEDYLARRRQLDADACDPVEPPAPAPWNARPTTGDPGAEEVVRAWLHDGELAAVTLDDAWPGHPAPVLLDAVRAEVTQLFSAGDRVAFHALQRGRYRGGLASVSAPAGTPAQHHLAGIVRVRRGSVTAGHVVRDRLGLARALTGAAA